MPADEHVVRILRSGNAYLARWRYACVCGEVSRQHATPKDALSAAARHGAALTPAQWSKAAGDMAAGRVAFNRPQRGSRSAR